AVALNDVKSVKEAFKIIQTNDRPPLKQFKDGTQDRGLAFVDYFKGEQKQFMMKSLKTFSENGHHLEAQLNEEISQFFEALLIHPDTPVLIPSVFTKTILNSIWNIVMGYTFSKDDPQMKILCDLVQRVTAIPGVLGAIGMWIPWLSNLLPNFTGVTSWVSSYRDLSNFVKLKAEERAGTQIRGHPRDITDAFIDLVEETEEPTSTFFPSNNFFSHSMADMLIASMDTTTTSLEWIILYLARHQDVQKRLVEEIAEVVTRSRLPTLSDRPSMPYTEAVISEVLRISAVVPMSLPHYTYADAEISGYFIPKDTLLIQNTWGIQHDPEVWDEPEEFRPERFLNENGRYKKNENLVVFGIGKRYCIGEFVARDQLFIFVTRIFQRFSIKYSGKPPSTHGNHGLVSRPEPFHIIFTEIL
ncbi:unnamed protein product, partial [Allacma fusca]